MYNKALYCLLCLELISSLIRWAVERKPTPVSTKTVVSISQPQPAPAQPKPKSNPPRQTKISKYVAPEYVQQVEELGYKSCLVRPLKSMFSNQVLEPGRNGYRFIIYCDPNFMDRGHCCYKPGRYK